jgi:outer membrane protein OmpA-like peptidoglycan-associated protein
VIGQRFHLPALLLVALLLSSTSATSQMRDPQFTVGGKIGGLFSSSESGQSGSGYDGRGFFRHRLGNRLRGELGVEVGELTADNFKTQLIPVDYRLLFSPYVGQRWRPYFYAGAGALHYEYRDRPSTMRRNPEHGWTGVVPLGVGAEFMVDNTVALDISAGYAQVFRKGITSVDPEKTSSYFNALIGVVFIGDDADEDPDKDGLLTRDERRGCTDPLNADTDGDGLSDGDEIRRLKTDPCVGDSDGDGLKDGEEIRTYQTDPLNADTDGDRLADGAEVVTHRTNPLRADTDGDGLTDGDEVLTHTTDPLNPDTDGGTVADGVEVRRGTNPLTPADDIPRKETLAVEIGKPIVLEGVVFDFNSSRIRPESEQTLLFAYNTMNDNPGIEVEIHGHTDNIGKAGVNLKLSQSRANSVKQWLVARGVDPARIGTKGFGFVRPIAPNDTEAGRQKNRRIEFVRVK